MLFGLFMEFIFWKLDIKYLFNLYKMIIYIDYLIDFNKLFGYWLWLGKYILFFFIIDGLFY